MKSKANTEDIQDILETNMKLIKSVLNNISEYVYNRTNKDDIVDRFKVIKAFVDLKLVSLCKELSNLSGSIDKQDNKVIFHDEPHPNQTGQAYTFEKVKWNLKELSDIIKQSSVHIFILDDFLHPDNMIYIDDDIISYILDMLEEFISMH